MGMLPGWGEGFHTCRVSAVSEQLPFRSADHLQHQLPKSRGKESLFNELEVILKHYSLHSSCSIILYFGSILVILLYSLSLEAHYNPCCHVVGNLIEKTTSGRKKARSRVADD